DDRGGAPLAEARDVAQQARGRAVTVDTDVRDARDEGFVQGAGERELVDVVLILSDADCPGLDLHQLRERVLQAAGDADGAAQSGTRRSAAARAVGAASGSAGLIVAAEPATNRPVSSTTARRAAPPFLGLTPRTGIVPAAGDSSRLARLTWKTRIASRSACS